MELFKFMKKEPETIWEKADDFISYVRRQDFKRFDDLMFILKKLPALKLRDGYIFDAYYIGDQWGGMFMTYCHQTGPKQYYVPTIGEQPDLLDEAFAKMECSQKGETYVPKFTHVPYNDRLTISSPRKYGEDQDVPPALPYFEVPFTEEGILQAWLLDHLTDFMPLFWHAGYRKRTHLWTEDDADTFCFETEVYRQLKQFDLSSLLPKITIEGSSATFTYAFWNNWQGLVKATERVEKSGSSVHFAEPEFEVLLKYDCGIMF